MDAGRARRQRTKALRNAAIEPLHVVLIEEPEAHLHAQVQQVFIKKAYKVRKLPQNVDQS